MSGIVVRCTCDDRNLRLCRNPGYDRVFSPGDVYKPEHDKHGYILYPIGVGRDWGWWEVSAERLQRLRRSERSDTNSRNDLVIEIITGDSLTLRTTDGCLYLLERHCVKYNRPVITSYNVGMDSDPIRSATAGLGRCSIFPLRVVLRRRFYEGETVIDGYKLVSSIITDGIPEFGDTVKGGAQVKLLIGIVGATYVIQIREYAKPVEDPKQRWSVLVAIDHAASHDPKTRSVVARKIIEATQ